MFDTLQIAKIVQETNDTISIFFDIPTDKADKYNFKAGQYLTIKADINGEEVRRSYSICTPPHASSPAVSIKRLEGGVMSNYLHDKVQIGDVLEVMKPEGRFTVLPDVDLQRDHYFFAAGSGITPIISMIRELLEHEPKSTCHLLYGSRSEEGIIFQETLKELEIKYQDQLKVTHTISRPNKVKSKGLGGLLGKKKTTWKGETGRIDRNKVIAFLDQNPSYNKDQLYYICGPGNMISSVATVLSDLEVNKDFIKQESFGGADPKKSASTSIATGLSTVIVTLNGSDTTLTMDGSKSILDELIDLGINAPYSCTSGACSTCMAKVTSGEVKMDACYALDDDEVADGYILTCQAKPITKEVGIVFEG